MNRLRLGLANQLLLAFIAVVSLPLGVLALYFGWKWDQDLQDRAEAAVESRLERTAEAVGRTTEVLESVASTLAGYRALVDYTVRPGAPSAQDLLAVKDLLVSVDRIQALNPNIVRTRLFYANPDFPEVWPFLYQVERLQSLPWKAQVDAGKTIWRLGHQDDLVFQIDNLTRKDRLVSLVKRVSDPYGAPLGIVQVSTTVDPFFDGLFSVDKAPQAALWDPTQGTTRDPWDRPLGPALSQAPGRLGLTPAPSGLLEGTGGQPTVAWRVLPHLGVVLLAEVPPADRSGLGALRWALALGALAILGLAALLFGFGTRLLLRRLETVSAAVRQVRQGNWDVQLPVVGNDEVTELSQTFQDLLTRLRELVDGVVREQLAAKDAELRALQSQINAHFLYNALEAIRMTAFVDGQDRVADALAALGRTLRYGMEWDRPLVTLKEEVAHAEAYIVLWNLRFGGGLVWEKNLAPGWEDWPMVKVSLQPLVENAVVHGLASRGHRGRIRLEAAESPAGRTVTVADDGVGQSADRWAHLGQVLERGSPDHPGSIGLGNVHERLKKTFCRDAGVALEGTADGWTRVTLRLPPGGNE